MDILYYGLSMPLSDGEKGVVLQRDRQTYAIIPHLPCGLVSPEMLRKIADVAEKFGGALKCTSAQRIAIVGLREEDIDKAWELLGGCRPGHASGSVVRSIRACPGTEFCKRGRQNSLGLGLELDRRYHGKAMPGKLKIGVSGCGNQCSETSIKDIGLVGGARGWMILVGGQCGATPKLGKEFTESEISTEQALQTVEKIIHFYETRAQPGERLGDTIARLGMQTLKQEVGAV
jgi:NAD(P)H-nitrite reductase large subunit